MNSRNTIAIVAAFLAMFWVFGLIVSVGKTRLDETALFPTLKASSNTYEVDAISVERTKGKTPEEFHFSRTGEQWYLAEGKQSIKVDQFRVRDLINEVKDARRDEETIVGNDPAAVGLTRPSATITLTGHPRKKEKDDGEKKPDLSRTKEWKLFLGNESVDKKFVYAASSDRPGRIFAVPRASLNAVFFKSANDLRSKRLFDFSEPSVQSISLKDGSTELEAKKAAGGTWLLTKPNLGYADFEGGAPPKEAPPGAPAPEGGIKGLLAAITAVRVDSEDDFVPPASDTLQRNDLVAGKERLRIQVLSGDDKKPTDETLLVGREDKDYYYARLATDEGTFKIQKKLLTPVLEAMKAPEKLRSRDLSPVTIKDADGISLTLGKDEARFVGAGEPKTWHVELPGYSRTTADSKAVSALLESLQGKREAVAFKDVSDAEAAKVDAELGFDAPAMAASVYLFGLETGKDAKKDDPKLKKDAKPAVSWQFGKTENDQVWVKRTMPDGPTARFAIDKAAFDKILPREGLIGYLEPVLPKLETDDVVKIDINRGGKTVSAEKTGNRWMIKDSAGDVPADARKVEDFLRPFGALQIRRWVKKIDAKDDLEAYGLKSPSVTVTLAVKLDKLSAQAIGSALGQAGSVMADPGLAALGAAWANLQLGGEKIVVKFGKDTDKEDANSVYVQHSKVDRLSLAPAVTANLVRDADLRDRSTILQPQLHIAALAVGAPGYWSASPLVTGVLSRASADKVKQLTVTVRTPVELRTFSFLRKDKSWADQSGLKEFQVDDEHVNAVADLAARLDFNRIVLVSGGPKADQKLTPTDATVVVTAVMADLSVVTVTVGASYEGFGYFAQVSKWPGAVFLLNLDRVQPILRGASYFARERVAAN
jgi:hypothetical protein